MRSKYSKPRNPSKLTGDREALTENDPEVLSIASKAIVFGGLALNDYSKLPCMERSDCNYAKAGLVQGRSDCAFFIDLLLSQTMGGSKYVAVRLLLYLRLSDSASGPELSPMPVLPQLSSPRNFIGMSDR